MIDQTYTIFLEIIKFINEMTNNNEKINKIKLKNVLNSTSFEVLKKMKLIRVLQKRFQQEKP